MFNKQYAHHNCIKTAAVGILVVLGIQILNCSSPSADLSLPEFDLIIKNARSIDYVNVSGQIILDQGRITAALPGKVIRHNR